MPGWCGAWYVSMSPAAIGSIRDATTNGVEGPRPAPDMATLNKAPEVSLGRAGHLRRTPKRSIAQRQAPPTVAAVSCDATAGGILTTQEWNKSGKPERLHETGRGVAQPESGQIGGEPHRTRRRHPPRPECRQPKSNEERTGHLSGSPSRLSRSSHTQVRRCLLANLYGAAMNRAVNSRQVEVLRWIAEGCPNRAWPDESHKHSARALAARGLARVTRRDGRWTASITEAGAHFLDHGTFPDEPRDPEANMPARARRRLSASTPDLAAEPRQPHPIADATPLSLPPRRTPSGSTCACSWRVAVWRSPTQELAGPPATYSSQGSRLPVECSAHDVGAGTTSFSTSPTTRGRSLRHVPSPFRRDSRNLIRWRVTIASIVTTTRCRIRM